MALPKVVWYMRLVIDRWELYVPKMLRDLRAGVPWSTAEEVQRLADRFERGDLLRERIAQLRADARVVGLVQPRHPSVGKRSFGRGE